MLLLRAVVPSLPAASAQKFVHAMTEKDGDFEPHPDHGRKKPVLRLPFSGCYFNGS